MISRIYTVTEQSEVGDEVVGTYKGFNRRFLPYSELDQVAIYSVDGDLNIVAIDNHPSAAVEFVRYLSEQHPTAVIVGIYKRK